jgi:2-keto-3-deoxy-L-rhamnonate aldolase RhmA
MRTNPLKEKLKRGELALGTMMFEFLSQGVPQMAENMGLDFLVYDMEHNGMSFDTLRWQMALFRGMKVVPIIRIPAKEYHFVARSLDIGALGVMVPMVETAAEAEQIVSWTRYPPEGVRGAGFGFAHDDYTGGSAQEKGKIENQRTLVIAQIETPKGVENVEEIVKVPGIDMVQLGHMDLANFMGLPGQYEHPDFLTAIERVVKACKANGKVAGRMALTPEEARMWIGKGWGFLIYCFDVWAFMTHIGGGIEAVRKG